MEIPEKIEFAASRLRQGHRVNRITVRDFLRHFDAERRGSAKVEAIRRILDSLGLTMQAERRRRSEPIGQDSESLIARMTDSASHPNMFVLAIVGLTEPPSMADDRMVVANRTPPRQEVQRDHPGSMLSFALWQCDKDNHGWREGPPLTVLWQRASICWPGLHPPVSQFRTKKEYCFPSPVASTQSEHWPY